MGHQIQHGVQYPGTESRAIPIASRLVVITACLAAIASLFYGGWETKVRSRGVVIATPSPALHATALPVPSPTPVPLSSAPSTPVPTPHPDPGVRIGIVAGHWASDASDTGAVCPDGLTEVEVNFEIARRVVKKLEELGYQADLLEEYDARLEEYRADALVSIHADSCETFPGATPPASGFKVASVVDSMVPEAEARLVACLSQCYAARTGMYFHANSITYDMLYYHNFYEIHDQTPAAIIEVGFLGNDRALLTEQPDLVAQGIVEGIVCFIAGQ
ncbi:MAG: N-acetylmuramoyl-L-alanine amidase [Anaerolineae bacterium]|nr:N-acetylmuramoyl-L-alanine amidase [Anaerolineae bacterium]